MMFKKDISLKGDPLPPKRMGQIMGVILFIVIPLFCAIAFATGKAMISISWLCWSLFFWYIQMVGVLVGYHRYFSHKSFETSQLFGFFLGLLGCISGQKGPIFWTSQHRIHHRYCEEENDVHSPLYYNNLKGWNLLKGFFWSHFIHLVVKGPVKIDQKLVRDLMSKPELVFLENNSTLIFYIFGFLTFIFGGLSGFVWCFLIPTFFSWNFVMLVNSAVHIWGEKPYVSKLAPNCNARNNWWLSIFILGDNWHNNHHADMNSARAGFHWWQMDLNYYLIWLFQKLGLVWNVKSPNWKKLEEMKVL